MRPSPLATSLAAAATLSAFAGAQVVGSFSTSGVGCPSTPVDPQAAIGAADDTVSVGFALGFSFPYPGGNGSTMTIDIAPNGYVYLETGTNAETRCCNGSTAGVPIADFASATPSFAVFGQDLDATSGPGDVVFETDGVGRATVTWDHVPEFDVSGSANTCSLILFADGRATICWNDCAFLQHEGLIGYSPGGGAGDSGATDFSLSLPAMQTSGSMVYEAFGPRSFDLNARCVNFVPTGGVYEVRTGAIANPFVDPLTIDSDGIPTIGRTTTIDYVSVPSSTILTGMFIAPLATPGGTGLDLTPIGMPGCTLALASDVITILPTMRSFDLAIPNNPGLTGQMYGLQGLSISPGVNSLGLATSNLVSLTIGDSQPTRILASGANSFNSNPAAGFFSVRNGSGLQITAMRWDWVASSITNNQEFDTDQTGMADRADGGNSNAAGCGGTYRNGSDVTTGLDYAASIVSPCDSSARTGWVGSNPGNATNDWRTVDFAFTSFDFGDVFEFDLDTDNGGTSGGDMAGMVVTLTFSDGSTRSGELVMIDGQNAELLL